jgi:hypothetical protein
MSADDLQLQPYVQQIFHQRVYPQNMTRIERAIGNVPALDPKVLEAEESLN